MTTQTAIPAVASESQIGARVQGFHELDLGAHIVVVDDYYTTRTVLEIVQIPTAFRYGNPVGRALALVAVGNGALTEHTSVRGSWHHFTPEGA